MKGLAMLYAALLWTACTDAALYDPDRDPNLADRLAVTAHLCTEDPSQKAFPVRVAFVVDVSAEANGLDPGGRRADAVQDAIGRHANLAGHAFSVARFAGSAQDLTGGFTRDRTALDAAVELLRQEDPRPGRDIEAALQAASNAIDEALLSASRGEVARTTFVAVLVVAGPPVPFAAGEVAERVARMRKRVTSAGAAGLRLHVALLRPADAVLAEQAEAFYQGVALAGAGELVMANTALQLSLGALDLAAGTALFVRKQVIVTNRNAITTPLGIRADTDGDGISDEDERELGLDPLVADTDADGLSDRVEMLHRAGGQDPFVADAPDVCDALEDPLADSDADGLTDCEERVIGTDGSLFDTDADGLPDALELVCDTNPTYDDAVADFDFDGTPNAAECRAHTDPRGDDGKSRFSLAYRYREIDEGVRRIPFTSQPVQVTGVAILGASTATTPGVGRLSWDAPAQTLTWQDADPDDGAGRAVRVPGGPVTEMDIASASENRFVHVRVERRLLPAFDQQDDIVIGASDRTCFSLRVKNVRLVETADAGRGKGWNDIFVYVAQVPEGAPQAPGLFRVARIPARFLAPDSRWPPGPQISLRDIDFVLFGE